MIPRKDQLPVLDRFKTSKVVPIAAGRRYGKSLIGAFKTTHLAVTKPKQEILIFGPSWFEVELAFEKVKMLIDGSLIEHSVKEDLKFKIVFSNKSKILGRVASPLSKGKRGRGPNFIWYTEAAYIAQSCFTAIRPSRLDNKAPEFFESTPAGSGFFKKIWDKYDGFHFTTFDNPMIDPKDVEEDKDLLSDIEYQQEILGLFVDDQMTIFKEILLDTVFLGNLTYLNPEEGALYVAGIDLGRRRDKSEIYILKVTGKKLTIVYAETFAYNPNLAKFWTLVLDRISQLAKMWGISKLCIDQTGIGDMPTLELKNLFIENDISCQVEGIDFSYAVKNKWAGLMNTLLIKMEQGNLISPFDKELIRQLKSFRFETHKTLTGKTTQVFKSVGKSPDKVSALSLAVRAAPYCGTFFNYSRGNKINQEDTYYSTQGITDLATHTPSSFGSLI